MSAHNSPAPTPGRPKPGIPTDNNNQPFDPLRLCIYTTIAALGWLLGPFAVVWFGVLGLLGYWKAHKAGLTRSKCALGDVRIVLAYLFAITCIAVFVAIRALVGWFS